MFPTLQKPRRVIDGSAWREIGPKSELTMLTTVAVALEPACVEPPRTHVVNNPAPASGSGYGGAGTPVFQHIRSLSVGKLGKMPRDCLCPSVGPTPRNRRFHTQVPIITLPAAGPANDAARVRNNGARIGLECKSAPSSPSGLAMLRVNSSPAVLCEPVQAKTPRTARGMVRSVSKIAIDYPATRSFSDNRAAKRRTVEVVPRMNTPKVEWRPTKISFGNEETYSWDPDSPTGPIYTSKSRSSGAPTVALESSVRKMDALFVLRRAGRRSDSRPQSPAKSGKPENPQQTAEVVADEIPAGVDNAIPMEAEEALMYGILKDLKDNGESLKGLINSIQSGIQDAWCNGGGRHATSVISSRILAVALRKTSLLRDVEERTKSFEAVHARRHELVPLLVADKEPMPKELSGIVKFIASYTHPGHPAEENKSQFSRFVETFKLPKEHQVLTRLRAIADEAGEFWAQACLSQAEEGHGHVALRRLFDAALGTGVDIDNPMLVRATRIINDRLAERVLQDAKERQRKDSDLEESGKVPRYGAAGVMADKIEEELFASVKEGVPETDARLSAAKDICKILRQKDGERKRMEGRQKRLDASAASKK